MAKKRHNRTDGTTENAREDTRDDTEKRAMIQAIVIAILGWTGFSISDTSIKLLSDDYALSWIVRRQSILDTVHKNIRCASGSLV